MTARIALTRSDRWLKLAVVMLLVGMSQLAGPPSRLLSAFPSLNYNYDPLVTTYDQALNLASTTVAGVGESSVVERLVDDASGPSVAFSTGLVAPRTTGVLVEGAGGGTRTINFRPTTDPNWGLTRAHLDKHLFGSGPTSLRQIDAAGNPDLWRNYIQDLAGRPATATLKGGIQDVIGTFPRADGLGTFQFGIRIAPGSNGTWDLVTLLTKQ